MKNLEELGKKLSKAEQRFIVGGNGPFGCWDGPVQIECKEELPDPPQM